MSEKCCPLCTFEAPTVAIILSHLRTVHSSDPRFLVTCGLNGCASTSKTFSALYSHIYRHHQDYIKKRISASAAESESSQFEASVDVADQCETGDL